MDQNTKNILADIRAAGFTRITAKDVQDAQTHGKVTLSEIISHITMGAY